MTTEMLLSKVFDEMRNGVRHSISAGDYDRLREEFVFHMTDWRDDLERLLLLFQDPNRDPGDAARDVARFLYHALPHINAASRLLLDGVADPFAVDAAVPRATCP
jgi:hypothetical protein